MTLFRMTLGMLKMKVSICPVDLCNMCTILVISMTKKTLQGEVE